MTPVGRFFPDEKHLPTGITSRPGSSPDQDHLPTRIISRPASPPVRNGPPGPRGPCARHTRCRSPDRRAAARRCRSRRPARARGCSRPRRNVRSCDTKIIVPSKFFSASTSISLVARSRWLVGSSSTRKFGGSYSIRAITRRDFSPPDSARIFLSTSSPENWNAPARVRSAPMPSLRKVVLQLLDDREVRIEHVERLLREVAHLQAGAEPHLAGVRRAGARRSSSAAWSCRRRSCPSPPSARRGGW